MRWEPAFSFLVPNHSWRQAETLKPIAKIYLFFLSQQYISFTEKGQQKSDPVSQAPSRGHSVKLLLIVKVCVAARNNQPAFLQECKMSKSGEKILIFIS